MRIILRMIAATFTVISFILLGTTATSIAGIYKFNDCTKPVNSIPASTYAGPFNLWTGAMSTTAIPSASRYFWQLNCSTPTGARIMTDSVNPSYNNGDKGALRYVLPNGLKFEELNHADLFVTAGGNIDVKVDFSDINGLNRWNIANYTYVQNSTLSGVKPTGIDRRVFEAYVACTKPICKPGPYPQPKGPWGINIKDIVFTIRDTLAPFAWMSGTIVTGGSPVSGTRTLQAMGLDLESGVRSVHTYVNGTELISLYNLSCSTDGSKLVPCTSPFNPTITVDTTKSPWVNGNNTVVVCVRDYADAPSSPNTACTPGTTIAVNN